MPELTFYLHATSQIHLKQWNSYQTACLMRILAPGLLDGYILSCKLTTNEQHKTYTMPGKRLIIIYLTFLFLLTMHGLLPAAEPQLIIGTVVSVDRDSSKVTLKVPGAQGEPSREVVITVSEGWIPWGVRPGRTARAWGRMGKQGLSFSATAVRPGIGADRTGIRSRLRKNCTEASPHNSSPVQKHEGSSRGILGKHGVHSQGGNTGMNMKLRMPSHSMRPGRHR